MLAIINIHKREMRPSGCLIVGKHVKELHRYLQDSHRYLRASHYFQAVSMGSLTRIPGAVTIPYGEPFAEDNVYFYPSHADAVFCMFGT